MTEMVFVMASSVVDFGSGLFGIQLPVRELSPSEAKLLRELFPHTERDVQSLLTREALLGAIVSDPVIPDEGEPVKGYDKYPDWHPKAETPEAYRKQQDEERRR